MVIEYAGIVIRSVLTDKREKYYDSKVGWIYLFWVHLPDREEDAKYSFSSWCLVSSNTSIFYFLRVMILCEIT